MNRRFYSKAAMLSFGVLANLNAQPANEHALATWKPEDSVALTYYVASQHSVAAAHVDPMGRDFQPVVFSPTGKHFAIVHHRGDLEHDEQVYELNVWKVETVWRALREKEPSRPKPDVVLQMRSRSNRPGIEKLSFDDSGQYIVFCASDGETATNVFRLKLESGQCERLTNRTDLDVEDYVYRDGTLFYLCWRPVIVPPLNYPMEYVPRPPERRVQGGFTSQMFVRSEANVENEVRDALLILEKTGPSPVSPGGKKIIAIDWKLNGGIGTYILIDRTGAWRQLVAGKARLPATWSPDGNHAILLVHKSDDGRKGESQFVDAFLFQSEGEQLISLGSIEVGRDRPRVRWLNANVVEVLVGKMDTGPTGAAYELQDNKWSRVQPTPDCNVDLPLKLIGDLSINLRQGANQPPVLIACGNGKSVRLTEADPVLNRTCWVETRPFQWEEPNGQIGSGGLLLPRNTVPGERLPLVVQNYFYTPELFLPDGPHPSAVDCAQSLVARGIAVLQIEVNPKIYDPSIPVDSPAELERVQRRLGSAISALVVKGIVDPLRIGLTGFSRGGFQIYFAITHPDRHQYAAAVMDDSFTGNYSNYLQSGRASTFALYGKPFWQDKGSWLKLETSFNTDRVRTPAMFIHHSATNAGKEYRNEYPDYIAETMGAFDLNKKPIEYLIVPDGLHELRRPREQVALHQAVVDWMCFWLKGEMPKDPERAARWTILRKQQDEVLKTPPPPKGKWQFVPDPVQPEWHPPAEAKKEELKPEPAGANKN